MIEIRNPASPAGLRRDRPSIRNPQSAIRNQFWAGGGICNLESAI